MENKKYCNGCVNCVKISNLNSDVVEWKCSAEVPSEYMTEFGKSLYVGGEIGMTIMECNKFDGGKHLGENAEIFKDAMVTSRGKKRKQKAWDYFEGCWRA
jgi:hypothetical protein